MNLDRRTGLPYMVDDLNMRLSNSLVMHDGEPFYITEIEGTTVYGLYTEDQERGEFTLPTKKLDIRPVPLGYVNTARHAAYCTRMPHRRYKQGLNSACIVIDIPLQGKDEMIRSKAMARAILGKYPSIDEVIEKLDVNARSAAFHRYWALSKNAKKEYDLSYRGLHVGAFERGNLSLMENYRYLAEELEDAA